MKKAMPFLMCLLFALTIFFPAGTLVSYCFGYIFELASVSAFAVAIAMLSACAVILNLVFKCTFESEAICILLTVATPLSLYNAVFYIFECGSVLVVLCVLISAVCSCFLTIKYGRPLEFKIVTLALSGLMLLPVIFFGFTALIFGDIGKSTVVQTVKSPEEKYCAEVINSDNGALGGDTFVDVYRQSEIDAILFRIQKKPLRVYSGDWGEFENMQIYWKDDSCLVINLVEYDIKQY